ncbi:LLM class flavin-dependent oxidoreductase [Cellulomonas sp. HZM]|uniref:LLM class flavin-dependent oxidoreductase n=1 Tax=Cellulomonas sp. HZM TaxID=1454010 RepID=UPI000493A6AC|nr:LLM class flavin-dependent oxidoreductase [Cellulomonas sp. HZM]
MTAPRIGTMLPRDLPASQVLPFARRADELGFDELWVVEDLGFRGGVAQAAAVLAATDRIHVGIGILPAGARNAAFAAMEVATLAQLFPGRVTIGVGHGMPGWMRQVGTWPRSPLTLLGEHVSAVRSIVRGERVSVDGLVHLDDVVLDPSAVPDEVPDVLLGVRGPRSLALSGRVADGTVLAEPVTPQYVRAALEQVAAAGPHRLVAYNVAAVDDDEAAAVDAVRPALQWVGDPDWAPHLAPLEIGADVAALRAASAGREEFARALPDAWVRELALAGTPQRVRARIDELTRVGVTSNVLVPVGDPAAALEQLARVL